MRRTTHLPVALLLAVLSRPATAQAPLTAATEPIPETVETALRAIYAGASGEIRYFASSMNLDGGGHLELIVHVVGKTVCEPAGCDTLVFTPGEHGFRQVARIRGTRPPILASPRRSGGWRNLIVTVSEDGTRTRSAELGYDGTSYPASAAAAPARRDVSTLTEVVIPPYDSFGITRQAAGSAAQLGLNCCISS